MPRPVLGDALVSVLRMLPAMCMCGSAWAGTPCSAAAEAAKDHEQPAATAEAPLDAFTWVPRPLTITTGGAGHIAVDLMIPREFEVFRNDLHVTVLDARGLKIGEVERPDGRRIDNPWDEDHAEVYAQDVRLLLPVSAVNVPTGLVQVLLEAEVRGCSAKRCHTSAKQTLAVFVQVVPRDEAVAAE